MKKLGALRLSAIALGAAASVAEAHCAGERSRPPSRNGVQQCSLPTERGAVVIATLTHPVATPKAIVLMATGTPTAGAGMVGGASRWRADIRRLLRRAASPSWCGTYYTPSYDYSYGDGFGPYVGFAYGSGFDAGGYRYGWRHGFHGMHRLYAGQEGGGFVGAHMGASGPRFAGGFHGCGGGHHMGGGLHIH